MSGWIKIHREITRHWIFQDAEKFKWWIDLLVMASHEDYKTLVKDELITLKRGQLKVSLSFLATRWGRSKEKVLNFLRLLESDRMIERNSDRKSTTITICNYNSYQDVSDQSPTANRPQVRPISDQSPTEYKNVEECKEINNTTTAHTREEGIEWDDVKEDGYLERFRAQGKAREAMRMTGKSLAEVMSMLDVYRAKRKLQNRGHADYNQFCNLFAWYLEQGRLPQVQFQPPSKIISGQAIFDLIK